MNNVNFYIETSVVQSLSDLPFSKTAQSSPISSLISSLKSYVEAHIIDPNNKAKSIIDILGPGAIFATFRALNLTWLGVLISLAMKVFNINVGDIFSSIWSELSSLIEGDKQVSSNQIESIVQNSVQQHAPSATPQEAEQSLQHLPIHAQTLHDLQIVKLTMIQYSLVKSASFLDIFNSKKFKLASILSKVISWILKIGLASAGLMVAGDVVNKFLGRPNAFDHTLQNSQPTSPSSSSSLPSGSTVPVSTSQTKFKVNSSYKNITLNQGSPWTVSISNSDSDITQLLLTFSKDVYSNLPSDEIIESTPGFQAIKDRIIFFNRMSTNSPIIFIPPEFTSEKQIVDHFIDDVAQRST